ncbi:DUF3489 domain-containing protein [Silanimonas lenta]|uniref:DUF3489 domain-containing protein n=1 Tax=Silanimonas lenta TaxID=265429 RepID=UPI000410F423|nr:DUF3489 domain-containing protein [Silanimonas lenta]
MSTTPLTPAQHAILAYALEHTGGRIEWFPDHIKGGARQKVLAGLANRALIVRQGDGWVVADEGFEAMNRPRPTAEPAPPEADPEIEAAVTAAEAGWSQDKAARTRPRTRENERSEVSRGEAERVRSTRQNSKQARVIAMLRRPEGATVRQIVEATGWQPHTVRGTLVGALKKKLGLTIVSEKVPSGERIYRLA